MPTVRLTEETLKELERVGSEFRELKRIGFESLFKITPDIVIKRLIEDWDDNDKEDIRLVDESIRNGTWNKHPKKDKSKDKVKE